MKYFFVLLLLVACTCSTTQAQTVTKVKITDVVAMIDSATTPLVINFWATWCGPCVRELRYFEKVIQPFKAQGVKVVLVSLDYPDEFPKGITDFAKNNGYTSELLWLNESDPTYFCPKIDPKWEASIPVTLMINPAKKYRQFYNTQLLETQLKLALQQLVQ